jgi:cytochrome c oxidase subunit 3
MVSTADLTESWTTTAPAEKPEARAARLQLGLWMFLATVTMLLAALSSAYLVRRSGTDWRPVALPSLVWWNTLVLAASSAVLELGRRRRAGLGLATGLASASLLAGVFIVGQVGLWRALAAQGVYLLTNPHSSFIYLLTGVHAVHLLAALVVMLVTLVTLGGRRDADTRVALCATFWHYLTGAWVYLLALVTWV